MHVAGSPGSYFAYLKDCLEEWSKNKKLECTLSHHSTRPITLLEATKAKWLATHPPTQEVSQA